MKVYKPGQLLTVVKRIPVTPKWFVIGGPSCGDEAQTALKKWPTCEIVALEPSRVMVDWQLRNGFEGDIRSCALSDRVGTTLFHAINGSIGGSTVSKGESTESYEVECTTLDALDEELRFKDAFLWLDIEGSELRALHGGRNLLASGRVLAVNVEVCDRTPDVTREIARLLRDLAKLTMVDAWNRSGPYNDELWVKI